MFKLFVLILLITTGAFFIFRTVIVSRVIKNHTHLTDFKNITRPSSPNNYLVCPPDYCKQKPDEYAPSMNVSVEKLQRAWNEMLMAQPRVKLLQNDLEKMQSVYVQLSRTWHFPDFIDVQFFACDDSHSTLAVYSRSYFGYSDFGVNKKRVESWIFDLKNQIRHSK